MTDTDKQPAMAYPTPEQYEAWKAEAEEMDMSISEWIQAMVEAGQKKFDARVEPDETRQELREQRNDLKEELEHARDRIDRLETQLHRGERQEITEFVAQNPGTTYNEIVQHLIDTAGERVRSHLDELEGSEVQARDREYYLLEGE